MRTSIVRRALAEARVSAPAAPMNTPRVRRDDRLPTLLVDATPAQQQAFAVAEMNSGRCFACAARTPINERECSCTRRERYAAYRVLALSA